MITKKIKKLYKMAKKDVDFKSSIESADGDKLPIFPSDIDKAIIASIYYGYRVAKYGDDWDEN